MQLVLLMLLYYANYYVMSSTNILKVVTPSFSG